MKLAPAKLVVLVWHVSHGCVVATCPAGLPVAVVPLWQLAQFDVMPAWLKPAPAKLVVLLWHVSHGCVVAT